MPWAWDTFSPAVAREFYLDEFAPRMILETTAGAGRALSDEGPEEVAAPRAEWISELKLKAIGCMAADPSRTAPGKVHL